ncbi:MAG: hypothetical protein AAB587_00250, partial [Patescibacteria group bacterium]
LVEDSKAGGRDVPRRGRGLFQQKKTSDRVLPGAPRRAFLQKKVFKIIISYMVCGYGLVVE